MAGLPPTLSIRIDVLCRPQQSRPSIVFPQFALTLGPAIAGSNIVSGGTAVYSVALSTSLSRILSPPSAERSVKVQFAVDSHDREDALDGCQRYDHPFDLDLAVILAGFAFEAYNDPSDKAAVKEQDAAECETTYTCNQFLREVYSGELRIKLKGGAGFPALDPWGKSDPYVVLNLGGSTVRSRTCWATLEPVWNQELSLNVKDLRNQSLRVAAWDANVITAHRRMGNTSIPLESFTDGEKHELELQLEGIGGGAKITMEVEFKTFEEIEDENRGWGVKLFDFFKSDILVSAINSVYGKQGIKARDFVSSAVGVKFLQQQRGPASSATTDANNNQELSSEAGLAILQDGGVKSSSDKGGSSSYLEPVSKAVYQTIEVLRWTTEKLPNLDLSSWQLDEKIQALGLNFQAKAEAQYVEKGLALAKEQRTEAQSSDPDEIRSSTRQWKRVSKDVLRQTEEYLGSWVMQALAGGGESREIDSSKEAGPDMQLEAEIDRQLEAEGDRQSEAEACRQSEAEAGSESKKELSVTESTKVIFKTAESAMEAWALLASSCGSQSFVKSEFDKICFVENRKTDTQAAIWRDERRHRLVVAFRGTEKTRWRDVQTDLMLVPTGLNPERVGGGNFKDEIMVHSGFLAAYDSVRPRLLSILQDVVNVGQQKSQDKDTDTKWHVYVTGHSLGGALATLFALELSASKLAKTGIIKVTMYNYGSPRVGNKMFAQKYNSLVKDSWRIVNRRDIIPTVPKLMGYCHVAQPIYLAKGVNLLSPAGSVELLEDGYTGDVIGEATPDYIIEDFVKGEKQLLEKLIQTEIAMFRSIRDGTAIMQHMEDFYYIALLELVQTKMSSSRTM